MISSGLHRVISFPLKVILPEDVYKRQPFDPWMILYGLILIVMMRFRPQGIWGKAEK